MTLNIGYYGIKHGPWSVRSKLIRDLIRDSRPDVIALQAVRHDPGVGPGIDQSKELASHLPEYGFGVFQPADTRDTGMAEGSAFLSRLPLAANDYLALTLRPGLDDTNRRIVLHVRIDLPAGPLHLFNAHFSWNSVQAEDNVSEAIPYMGGFEGQSMAMGDMNQPPQSPAIARLAGAGWIDGWAAARPAKPGFTFESDHLTKRIDYIWLSPNLGEQMLEVRVLGEGITFRNARPSDHLGLLARLSVEV